MRPARTRTSSTRRWASSRSRRCDRTVSRPASTNRGSHYHFAGRADVLGWDTTLSALLRIENRTRFPDVQDSIGRFKNEQRYLASALWRPLGFEQPARTELHVMVVLWSAEVLRVLRQRPETFRSAFPDPPDAFFAWMAGTLPASGGSTFVLLDPLATGRQRRFIGLEDALAGARSRRRPERSSIGRWYHSRSRVLWMRHARRRTRSAPAHTAQRP